MNGADSLRCCLETALAFAHAALEDPTASRVSQARKYAAAVSSVVTSLKRTALTLSESNEIVARTEQLAMVLHLIEQRLEHPLHGTTRQ